MKIVSRVCGVDIPYLTDMEICTLLRVSVVPSWARMYQAERLNILGVLSPEIIPNVVLSRNLSLLYGQGAWYDLARRILPVGGQLKNFFCAVVTCLSVTDGDKICVRGSKSVSSSGRWAYIFGSWISRLAKNVTVDFFDSGEVAREETDPEHRVIMRHIPSYYQGNGQGYRFFIDDAYVLGEGTQPVSPVSPFFSLKGVGDRFCHMTEQRLFSPPLQYFRKGSCGCDRCLIEHMVPIQLYEQFCRLADLIEPSMCRAHLAELNIHADLWEKITSSSVIVIESPVAERACRALAEHVDVVLQDTRMVKTDVSRNYRTAEHVELTAAEKKYLDKKSVLFYGVVPFCAVSKEDEGWLPDIAFVEGSLNFLAGSGAATVFSKGDPLRGWHSVGIVIQGYRGYARDQVTICPFFAPAVQRVSPANKGIFQKWQKRYSVSVGPVVVGDYVQSVNPLSQYGVIVEGSLSGDVDLLRYSDLSWCARCRRMSDCSHYGGPFWCDHCGFGLCGHTPSLTQCDCGVYRSYSVPFCPTCADVPTACPYPRSIDSFFSYKDPPLVFARVYRGWRMGLDFSDSLFFFYDRYKKLCRTTLDLPLYSPIEKAGIIHVGHKKRDAYVRPIISMFEGQLDSIGVMILHDRHKGVQVSYLLPGTIKKVTPYYSLEPIKLSDLPAVTGKNRDKWKSHYDAILRLHEKLIASSGLIDARFKIRPD